MAQWDDNAGLGSGLPDHFWFRFDKVRASYPYEKNQSQCAVVMDGERRMEDGSVEDDHLWLKPGQQFEPGDKDGTFLVHQEQQPNVYEEGSEVKPKKINKNSGYGKFLNSVHEVTGSWGVLADNQTDDRAKFQIWDLLMWEGLEAEIEVRTEKFEFKNDAGEEIKGETRQPYVVAIYPAGSSGEAASGATATTAEAPSSAASSNGKPNPKDFSAPLDYISAVKDSGGDASDLAGLQAEWQAAQTS